ncbi:MAG: vWA domain-containing protein [Planctomycetota bacterium]|jgi:hypothetical protein
MIMGSTRKTLVGVPAIALAVAALNSPWAVASAEADGQCGCMDVVLLVDDTGSMGGAIANVKMGLGAIVTAAQDASKNDLRMGVVSFKDGFACGSGNSIEVDQPLTANIAMVTAAINALAAGGGAGLPEASDEALNYTVTAASACPICTTAGGTIPPGPPLGPFRTDCLKIAVLITDDLPAGCDDAYVVGVDDVNAANVANAAAAAGVLVSAVLVPTPGSNFVAATPIMQNYASVTGGVFTQVNPNGTGTAEAITEIIEACGTGVDLDIKPGSCPNSYNRSSHGVLPVALIGTEGFDVTQVDLDTLLLVRKDGGGGSVAPNFGPPGPYPSIEDVATPFAGEDQCDCHEETGDGIDDLMMHFRTDDVVANLDLNSFPPGALVSLTLTGARLDGTAFAADDCVRLVPPGTPPGLLAVASNLSGAWIDLTPPDDAIDEGGFANFIRSYPLTTEVTLSAPPAQLGWVFVGWNVVNVGFNSNDPVADSLDTLVRRQSITLPIETALVVVEAVYEQVMLPEPGDGPDPGNGDPTDTGRGWTNDSQGTLPAPGRSWGGS